MTQKKKANRSLKKKRENCRTIQLQCGTLFEDAPGRWRISWRDSSGEYHRVRLQKARNLEEALEEAKLARENPPVKGGTLGKGPHHRVQQDPRQIEISDMLLRNAES